MAIGLLALQLVSVSFLTIFLLNKYAQLRNQRLIVLASTFFGWFFSFLIIIVLPLDVAITFYKKCLIEKESQYDPTTEAYDRLSSIEHVADGSSERNESFMLCEEPKGFVEDKFLLGLWRIVYWSSQFLTWILLPILQSYAKAGEFTPKGRLKYAFYSNALYYGLYLIAFMFLLFYAVSKGVPLDFDNLKVLVVSASNTWGLFLLVVLLGYGLIEVPRHFWRLGKKGYRLQRTYFEIDKLSSDKNEAEDTIREVYTETKNVLNLLKSASGFSRDKVKQIASKFPYEFVRYLNGIGGGSKTLEEDNTLDIPTLNFSHLDAKTVNNDAYLVKLHRRVIGAVQNYQRCQAQWISLVQLAFYLEDVELAESTGSLPSKWTQMLEANGRRGHHNPSKSSISIVSRLFRDYFPSLYSKIRFLWHVTLRRPIMQLVAIYFAAMTTLILWSECTFFIVRPQLSLAARILHSAAIGYHYKLIQFCAIGMILYLCISAYYTIFRLRIYRYYRLDPNRMTDENSLIFSAMLICRLTAPMCLNFLGMIHLDSHLTANRGFETQFTKLMGHLDIIPLIAKGINVYLPIVIVVLCLATWFRIAARFLHNLGIDQFLEDEDEMIREMVQSGKALISLERNRINRAWGREERDQTWKAMAMNSGREREGKLRRAEAEEDARPILLGEEDDDEWMNSQQRTTQFGDTWDPELGRQGQKGDGGTADEQPQQQISPHSIFDDI